jgi:BlaI family penicillinase repressor
MKLFEVQIMNAKNHHQLSRRERQIMDVVIKLDEASVAEIMAEMPEPPSNPALRRLISILEEKGFITHRKQGKSYFYKSVQAITEIRTSAIDHLKETFFRGSSFKTVAAMLDLAADDLSAEELAELGEMINRSKEKSK